MLLRIVASLLFAGTLVAQHSETSLTNPFRSPDDRARGGAFFRSQCASCHGIDGKGGASGPNLTTGTFRHASNDEGLFRVITKGVPGTSMPGFSMNGREIWQIVAFIRGLSASRTGIATGDAKAGEQLFRSQNCLSCHWLHGAGNPRGPDLSAIATRLSPAELSQALTDPSAEVAPEYWRWSSGSVQGYRLNEDTFSVQILDKSGKLLTLPKALHPNATLDRRSPMPSFAGKLSANEINNLAAYLATLQGGGVAAAAPSAPPPADRPGNWLTYHGNNAGHHHSRLAAITPQNAANLSLQWTFQAQSLEKFEATPLVVDGVMYLTEAPNTVIALDATTGREYWIYEHKNPDVTYPCCGKVNRGLAIHGQTLFMGTLDGKLVAIDAVTGQLRWETVVVDFKKGYALTHAPLVVKDTVLIGTAGGELGIRGFLAAYNVQNGAKKWQFDTIPAPGEPGFATWGGDSWKHGGGPIWLTGSYDPVLNLTYWGVGNAGPDWNAKVRPGDNLYTSSVIALNADTGKLQWHFQFTPHDEWDWDAVQTPVLVDREWRGKPRQLMLWANRNGFFYVLDRATGEFLQGTPFVKLDWAKGLDDKGRPIRVPGKVPSPQGTVIFPGVQGGTNWFAPSYSPRTDLFYLNVWDDYSSIYFAWDQEYEQGKWYAGGGIKAEVQSTRRDRLARRDPKSGYGAVRALHPTTGAKVWEYRMTDVTDGGIVTTASNVLFTGNREGHFFALDATSGKLLWDVYLGGQMAASPITYEANGKQYVSVAIGHTLYTFALRP